MKPTPEQLATLEKIQRATRTKEEHLRIKKCGTKADMKEEKLLKVSAKELDKQQ